MITELIDRYCAVWNLAEPDERKAALAEIWGDGGTYTDPTVHAASAAELLVHITQVRARRPGARVVRTSAVDAHHDVARFTWHVELPDGTTLPEGIDFAWINSEASHIERIVGFFGPLKRD